MRFEATAWREAPWWVIEVPDVGVTQVRWLRDAEWMARDLVACALDISVGDVEVVVSVGVGPHPYPGSRSPMVWLGATLDGIRDQIRQLVAA